MAAFARVQGILRRLRSVTCLPCLGMPVAFLILDYLVTVTGDFRKLRSVHDGHVSSCVRDHARFLQNAGGYANARSSGSSHLSQEFLSQGHCLAADPVMAHHEPSRQSFLNIMEAVASSKLANRHPKGTAERC